MKIACAIRLRWSNGQWCTTITTTTGGGGRRALVPHGGLGQGAEHLLHVDVLLCTRLQEGETIRFCKGLA